MKSGKWIAKIILIALLVAPVGLFLFKMVYAQTPMLWTDKDDYTPEETVTIYGAGFASCSTITINLVRPDEHLDEWNVESDNSGSFTTTYQLDGIAGIYRVTASDGHGNVATTTFSDRVWYVSVSPNSATVPQGGSITATVSVTANPPGGPEVDLWATGQPSNVTVNFSPSNGVPPFTSIMTINVSSTVPPGTYTIYIIVFTGQPGYPSYSEKARTNFTLTVTGIPPQTVSITITSSPVTGEGFVKVDGALITTPTTFTWAVGSTHTLEALSPVPGPSGTRYVWTGWSDSGDKTHTYVVPDSDQTVTANYNIQYLLVVATDPTGLSQQPQRNPAGEAGSANGWWYDAETSVTLSAQTVAGYNFNYWDVNGESQGSGVNPITVVMNAPVTAVARYNVAPAMATVTFSQVGVGGDFDGVVLTVDGVDYRVSDLPMDFVWPVGSTHSFGFHSPLDVNGKRYVWSGTSGLSTLQSGTITVGDAGGSVTGYYKIQYRVAFGQNGVGSDFDGTVVVVDGESLCVSDLPKSYWWDSGSVHNFEFQSPLTVSAGRQYLWQSTSGLSTARVASLTVTGSGNVTGNYEVYVPPAQVELSCQCFVADGRFNRINVFTTVFIRINYWKYRLASTRPNAFYFVMQVSNPGTATGPVSLSFQLDPEFVIVGVDPVQVHTGYGRTGQRISASVTFNANGGSVSIDEIGAGQTLYVTVSMDYKFKGQTFSRSEAYNWVKNHPSNTFHCTLTEPNTSQCSVTITDPPSFKGEWAYSLFAMVLIGSALAGLKFGRRRWCCQGNFGLRFAR
ncbi:MAG: hypothetical protein QXH03_00925 [Candidatus Bathyarchaeia archaeon]